MNRFKCETCGGKFPLTAANLSAEDEFLCDDCYLMDPPLEDVYGICAEVLAHLEDM